jgi:hypothetical protein
LTVCAGRRWTRSGPFEADRYPAFKGEEWDEAAIPNFLAERPPQPEAVVASDTKTRRRTRNLAPKGRAAFGAIVAEPPFNRPLKISASRRPALHLAVTERPIFFRDLDQVDEDILLADACLTRDLVGDPSVKLLLHVDRATRVPGV